MAALEEDIARAKEIAEGVVQKEAVSCDEEARWPEQSMRALQKAGLGGLVVPAEYGGRGHGLYGMTRVCETLAYGSGSVGICFGMHNVGTAVIAAKATEEQVERYLVPIARGAHLTTLALSEPGTGAHFYYPETRLTHTADGFEVTGTKTFSTNGGHADSYVTSTVAADPDAPPGLFSCVMVPNEAEGLQWDKPYRGFGMRGNAARTFHMEGVRIPRRDLLGEEGDQTWYIFNVVAPFFLVSMAGTYLGIAQRAVNEALGHLGKRVYSHSGQGLAGEPVLQHKLGRLWARVEETRRLVYWAAEEADRGGPQALPALCSAKARVAETAVHATNEAMTLMGGIAYGDNALMGRLLRDARAAHVMAPTTDVLWTWAGRALLEIPLLGD